MRQHEVVLDREAIRHSIHARKGVDRAQLELELAREYGLTPEEVVAVLLELEAEERGLNRQGRPKASRSAKPHPA